MKIILAEKMVGRSVKSIPMADVYNLPTTEILFKEYRKAIPELTIDDTARKQAELDQERAENTELQKKVNEIKNLQKKMDGFENMKQELREEFKEEIQNLKASK